MGSRSAACADEDITASGGTRSSGAGAEAADFGKRKRAKPARAATDSALLSALRGGMLGAIPWLHDRVRPQVNRTIRRLLGPGDMDREDVAQLAMIELVGAIGRYRGECSLDRWTNALTANVVYKHLRRRRSERRLFQRFDGDQLEEAPSPSRTHRDATLRSIAGRVCAHLDQIGEGKASTFVLHAVAGYDLREIAQMTGVSVSAAQTRLSRGRREIQDLVASDPELATLLESEKGEL